MKGCIEAPHDVFRFRHEVRTTGATATPRKPNYDFERRERERSKAAESAKKAQAKADKRALQEATPASPES
jgi:hypothetical protein